MCDDFADWHFHGSKGGKGAKKYRGMNVTSESDLERNFQVSFFNKIQTKQQGNTNISALYSFYSRGQRAKRMCLRDHLATGARAQYPTANGV